VTTSSPNQARTAWQRLQADDRMAWVNWVIVGHALIAGRTEAMKAAGCNSPEDGGAVAHPD
jgi:hypothetical protein